MKQYLSVFTSSFAIIVLVLSPSLTCASPQNTKVLFDHLAQETYEALWDFHPVDATYAGFHVHDARLGSYTPQTVAETAKKLKEILGRIEGIDSTRLSVDDQIDRALLISNLKMELFRLEKLRTWETNPKFYTDECINGIYYLLLRDFAPLSARAQRAAERMRQIPRVLDEARQNVRNPPRLYAAAAIEELSAGEEFIDQSAKSLGQQFPGLNESLQADAQQAIAAMRKYRTELAKALPGLKDNFAMGKADYTYILKTDDLLPFDSDSLLRIGENAFAETDSLIKALSPRKAAYDKAHPAPEQPVLRPPRYFSKADIIAYQQDEIDSMRDWVAKRGIASVPDYVGRLQMTETPAFLLGIIPGAAMEPPAPLDSVQTSYYYEPPFPDPLDSATKIRWYNTAHYRRWKGGVVHEGYPGHHLQLSIANHTSSLTRKLQGNTPMIEGWALYCEQLAAENGLYDRRSVSSSNEEAATDSFLPLHWLGGVNFRAARIILDVKLHTGKMSYDDAWKYMVENFGPDTSFFQREVRRYCLSPTQPMSYLVGKLQIIALRDEFLSQGPDRRDSPYSQVGGKLLKEFHDRLLNEGSIPVSLIRRKLIEH